MGKPDLGRLLPEKEEGGGKISRQGVGRGGSWSQPVPRALPDQTVTLFQLRSGPKYGNRLVSVFTKTLRKLQVIVSGLTGKKENF